MIDEKKITDIIKFIEENMIEIGNYDNNDMKAGAYKGTLSAVKNKLKKLKSKMRRG